MLNLDANASYGLVPEVQEWLSRAIRPGGLGLNPSSIHQEGQRAKALIEDAREQVREAIGAGQGDRIIFTSGATESNNQVFELREWKAGEEILTTSIEHPSIRESCAARAARGVVIQRVSPRSDGNFQREDFLTLSNEKTKLLTVMLANNESGQVLPVSEIAAVVRKVTPQILVHSDAVQAFGKIPLAFSVLGVDALSLSGHKCGGLSGVGVLVLKDSVDPRPLLRGGPQESRLRAGTENVLGIGSLGVAMSSAARSLQERARKMSAVRNAFEAQILAAIPGVKVLVGDLPRLPNTTNFFVPGVRAHELVIGMDLASTAISSGSACASGKPGPSETLRAYGLTPEEAVSSVRISFRHDVQLSEVAQAAEVFSALVARLRRASLTMSATSGPRRAVV